MIKRSVVTRARLLSVAFLLFAFGSPPALAQSPPSYISVNPDEVRRVLGSDIAQRALSGEYTELRKKKLDGTLAGVPGLDCSKGWRFGLVGFVRYADLDDQKSWIERYAVECNKPAKRSLLMVIRGSELIESTMLLPGDTIADPQLQMNALGDLTPLALAKAPRDCQYHTVVDTAVTEPPSKGAWKERWSFWLCGETVDVDAAFLPAPNGGTTVIGQVRK